MKHTDILDGMNLHYTSVIGRGPSVPVVVVGQPYRMGDHWSAWVKRVSEPEAHGFSVHVSALYKRPVPEGSDVVRCPKCQRNVSVRNGRYSRHGDIDRHGRRSRLTSKLCRNSGALRATERTA